MMRERERRAEENGVRDKLYLLSVALSKLTFVSTSFSDSHLTHRSASRGESSCLQSNSHVFNNFNTPLDDEEALSQC